MGKDEKTVLRNLSFCFSPQLFFNNIDCRFILVFSNALIYFLYICLFYLTVNLFNIQSIPVYFERDILLIVLIMI